MITTSYSRGVSNVEMTTSYLDRRGSTSAKRRGKWPSACDTKRSPSYSASTRRVKAGKGVAAEAQCVRTGRKPFAMTT
jgi:hypothetical protein